MTPLIVNRGFFKVVYDMGDQLTDSVIAHEDRGLVSKAVILLTRGTSGIGRLHQIQLDQ